ncbi:epoxide hydrolase [Actinomadura logoneensis]|uniref:Epoxide hydrolase n=1 Tax=Actinomadura logoneensis TaxID=2293572 RepID=A0A372JIC9_9ACTN|nr:epoxide hydrolase [Actinomadura logoneensis]RFU39771.1 epoxide hydrolase [Actinomadura logoneensis]
MSDEIRPFRIDIPQADLDDLHDRLARTRWGASLPGDGWERGVPVAFMRELAEYWRTGFDWRAQEARFNGFPQFVTEIDGYDVHFLHVRSDDPEALPVLLAHGWPNSFVEFARLVRPLTERGFHVVVPTIPGVGFSAAPRETGWDAARLARMWNELMRRLGYERYGVEGGDFGAYVAPAMAEDAPENVTGVYVISGLGFPTEKDVPDMLPDEKAQYDLMQRWMGSEVLDHHHVNRVAARTFGYGWADSPVAALAWMTHKFQDFATGSFDAVDRDLFLANVSLYWFTRSFATASWPYHGERGDMVWPQGQKAVPSGTYSGPPGIRRLAERTNEIVHWGKGNPGSHHFVAMEEPDAVAADMRLFFDKVR